MKQRDKAAHSAWQRSYYQRTKNDPAFVAKSRERGQRRTLEITLRELGLSRADASVAARTAFGERIRQRLTPQALRERRREACRKWYASRRGDPDFLAKRAADRRASALRCKERS